MTDMLGWSSLKKHIRGAERGTVCPVEGCTIRLAERQQRTFRVGPEFACPVHGIAFSASTFEHLDPSRNAIWGDYGEYESLDSKRESRFGRENSEDAVTWNVFRFLETHGLLAGYLSELAQLSVSAPKTIFWSHDRESGQPWAPLMEARAQFELNPAKGSEPDLMVMTDRCLFVIEAKLTAGNATVPGTARSRDRYVKGGDGWWHESFSTDCENEEIAEQSRLYELMRFWLIGSWMARMARTDFRLINLLRSEASEEADIEFRFRRFLRADAHFRFLRATWEGIRTFIAAKAPDSADRERMISYFGEKTMGYRDGDLRRAFAVDGLAEITP